MADSALVVLDEAAEAARLDRYWNEARIHALMASDRTEELRRWGLDNPLPGRSMIAFVEFLALRGLRDDLDSLATRPELSPEARAMIAYYSGDFLTADSIVAVLASAPISHSGKVLVQAWQTIIRSQMGLDTSELEASLRQSAQDGPFRAESARLGLARLEVMRGNPAAAIRWLEPYGSHYHRHDPHLAVLFGTEEFEATLRPRDGG